MDVTDSRFVQFKNPLLPILTILDRSMDVNDEQLEKHEFGILVRFVFNVILSN